MARKREDTGRSCPHCGSTSVCRNGKNRGQQRFLCTACEKTFGERSGTPMFGLHTPAEEVARTLLILMRRGSLIAAEEISRHKWETIKTWLLRVSAHAEAMTEVLAKDLELGEVEVDAFWSFVGNAVQALQTGRVRHKGWATPNRMVRAGAA
jgi:transposase-like protein